MLHEANNIRVTVRAGGCDAKKSGHMQLLARPNSVSCWHVARLGSWPLVSCVVLYDQKGLRPGNSRLGGLSQWAWRVGFFLRRISGCVGRRHAPLRYSKRLRWIAAEIVDATRHTWDLTGEPRLESEL